MKRAKQLLQVLIAAALLLGCAAAAQAQSLVVSPTSVTFLPGQATFQTLSVALSNGGNIPFTVTATSTGNWLKVTAGTGTTGSTTPVVYYDATNLTANTYTGSLAISAAGVTNSPVTVPVTLVVGSSSTQLSANPTSLTFTPAAMGPQTVAVSSTTASPIGFNALPTAAWLSVSPGTGTATTSGTSLIVSVNPAGLAAGAYDAAITVTPTGGVGGGPLTIPVHLTISGTPVLSVSTNSLSFAYQQGSSGPQPSQQTVTVSSGGIPVQFSATTATESGTDWLRVSPSSGTTQADLTVFINTNVFVLPANTVYRGTITITAPAASSSPQTIEVNLRVSTNPILVPSPGSLSFTYQPGASVPAAQSVAVSSTGSAVQFIASSGTSWLAITQASSQMQTPATIQVGLNPAVLTTMGPGNYTGSVTLTSAYGTSSVPVALSISSTPALVIQAPNPLAFNYQVGRFTPPAQAITIGSSTGAQISFTAQSNTSWIALGATSGTTGTPSAGMYVFVNPQGLAARAAPYEGSITFTPIGTTGSPAQTLNVTLRVSDTPLMNASVTSLTFNVPVSDVSIPQVQYVDLTSTGTATDPALTFTASATATTGGTAWLAVSPGSGPVPNRLTVFVSPSGLPVGNYAGTVTVAASSGGSAANTITIPVSVNVSAGSLVLDKTSLSFSQALGGSAPAAQTVKVSSDPSATNLPFTAIATTTTGQNWLRVTPASGTTSPVTNLSVSVDATGLAAGSYNGSIAVAAASAANSPQTISVTFTVGAAQTIAVSSNSLSFSYQIGSAAPAAQTFRVTSTGGALSFTATPQSSAAWLKASPASGSSPADVSVSIDPAGLTAGTYNGTISVAAAAASNSPLTVSVALTVTAAPLPKPVVTLISNGASYVPGGVVPLEIVYLEGTNLGPAALTPYKITNGRFDTEVADTQVLFDNIPSPIIYVSARQTSVIVPRAVAGRVNVSLQVSLKGVKSDPIVLQVRDSAPGVFTIPPTGSGQGAILNQDYSVNGAANGAQRGSVVMVYATGEGVSSPFVSDGGAAPLTEPFPRPLQQVRATIGGREAEVVYAGSAPGLVMGLLQVNVKVPNDVPSGAQAVMISVGGVSSQPGVTLTVR